MISNKAVGISKDSIVVVSQDQVSCDLSGESAILNLKAGLYYCLNELGTRIWKLIHEPKKVCEIRDAILAEYEVEPDRCEIDILALLQKLIENGLIQVMDESIK